MVVFEHVTKRYRTQAGDVAAIADLTFEVRRGEFVSVMGPSGSGKSTLLMASGGMLHPSAGTVRIAGEDLYAMRDSARARFRARNIGFVFQMFHLVPYLNVLENVMLAQAKADKPESQAIELLDRLRLSHRVTHKPSALSVGERQRAAIARALITNPKLILADEPTGNLDAENSSEVFEILRDYHLQGGTVIVVSHDTVADEYATRLIRMRDGRVV